MAAEAPHRCGVADAGLGDHHCPIGSEFGQACGAVEVDGEIVKIAVVHAEDFRAELDGTVSFVLVDHLGEHVHVERLGDGSQVRVLLVGKDGEHEQDRVGAEVARGVDLDLVDDEVLAQYRQMGRRRDSG